jgi:hypothetical protein
MPISIMRQPWFMVRPADAGRGIRENLNPYSERSLINSFAMGGNPYLDGKTTAATEADRRIEQKFCCTVQSSFSKYCFSAPHFGQTQSSGKSSKAVPGMMLLSGSPSAGS